MHANIVLSQDLIDYSPLFVEIADAYFDREMYAEASTLYELLGEDAAVSLSFLTLLPSLRTRTDTLGGFLLDQQFRHSFERSGLSSHPWEHARSSGPL